MTYTRASGFTWSTFVYTYDIMFIQGDLLCSQDCSGLDEEFHDLLTHMVLDLEPTDLSKLFLYSFAHKYFSINS